MMTVKSAPGLLVPTIRISRLSLAPGISGGSAVPATEFEIVAPSANISEHYRAPFCVICSSTGPPTGACRIIANTSRTECALSTIRSGVAPVSIARNAST